ncbi:MAG: hypothetical protein GX127_05110 [Eubacteriaceae bacterium]|nr:hypothetical protein [Eubacteriaceae bacterium]
MLIFILLYNKGVVLHLMLFFGTPALCVLSKMCRWRVDLRDEKVAQNEVVTIGTGVINFVKMLYYAIIVVDFNHQNSIQVLL